MKRFVSLLCLCTMLFCLILSNAYAASNSEEATAPDASTAVVIDDDQAEQPVDMAVAGDEEAGETLHVKAPTDLEKNAVEEDALQE